MRLLENEAAGKGRLRGGRETAKAQALQGHGADLPSFLWVCGYALAGQKKLAMVYGIDV